MSDPKAAKAPDHRPRTPVGGLAWKLLSTGATVMAAKTANAVATKGWSAVTGRPVPLKTSWDKGSSRDVVAYSALSAALLTGLKVAAERGAAEYYRKSAGHLPQALTEPRLSRKQKKAKAKAEKAAAKAAKAATR